MPNHAVIGDVTQEHVERFYRSLPKDSTSPEGFSFVEISGEVSVFGPRTSDPHYLFFREELDTEEGVRSGLTRQVLLDECDFVLEALAVLVERSVEGKKVRALRALAKVSRLESVGLVSAEAALRALDLFHEAARGPAGESLFLTELARIPLTLPFNGDSFEFTAFVPTPSQGSLKIERHPLVWSPVAGKRLEERYLSYLKESIFPRVYGADRENGLIL